MTDTQKAPPPREGAGPRTSSHGQGARSSSSLPDPGDVPADDPGPLAVCFAETVDDLVRGFEVDDANNRWWYEFGRQVGRDVGYAEGYAAAERDMNAHWSALAARVRRTADVPTFAEVDARRWSVRGEPRTREAFAGPHPDDHPGGDTA